MAQKGLEHYKDVIRAVGLNHPYDPCYLTTSKCILM